jgi:hypothetical protein
LIVVTPAGTVQSQVPAPVKVTVVRPFVVTDAEGEQVGLGAAMEEALREAIPKSAAKPKPQTIALRLVARGFKNCVNILF